MSSDDRTSHGRSPWRNAFEIAMNRPVSTRSPHFAVRSVKGVGGAVVHEWDVDVPVCDEFPSAHAAFDAAVMYARSLQDMFAPRDTLTTDLKASVRALESPAAGRERAAG